MRQRRPAASVRDAVGRLAGQRLRTARHLLLLGSVLAPVLALAVTSLTHLADRGYLLVHQCVPASGAWGWVGTNLALVRHSAECPVGTAALGGEPAHAATVLGVLALPVALAHAAALLAGWGATSAVHRALVRLRGVLRTPRPSALADVLVDVPAPVRTTAPVAPRVTTWHHLVLAAVHPRRGPPSGTLALA